MPQISVIVPIYKAERMLATCIDSILAQTFDNFELILVDDGSPDDSVRIGCEYASKDKRIRVLRQNHKGVWRAEQYGAKKAKAKQLVFIEQLREFGCDALENVVSGRKKEAYMVSASAVKWKLRQKFDRLLCAMFLPSSKQTVKMDAYLWKNLGDDLMVKILLERYPRCQFFIDSPHVTASELMTYDNLWDREKLLWYHRRKISVCDALTGHRFKDRFIDYLMNLMDKQCRCTVQIGGSLFVRVDTMSLSAQLARQRKRTCHTPAFIMGVNFNPNESEEYIRAFTDFFADCENVSFRDDISYQTFASLANVQCAPDIVFNLSVGQPMKQDGSVLISVINFRNRPELQQYASAYETYIFDVCQEAVARQLTPILVSFCSAESDDAAIRELQKKMPANVKEKVKAVYYDGDTKEILTLYEKTDFVVATRFHAMILAILYQKPFFAINYNDKIRHIMSDFDMENYAMVTELTELKAKDAFVWADKPILRPQLSKASERHFAAFDRFVEKNHM